MKPVNNKLELSIENVDAGIMKTDAIAECGVIIGIGANHAQQESPYDIGDILYFKAWALDIITDRNGIKRYFIDADSEAICAVETM